ncbi:DNA-binding GntR family transcriptional regulator [Lachnotalea glycerini]|jgi:DNA-binding GntR family transcriptional regulator|uniref:GntR family transcriptional regulator n=1 Tax=Lachnotalea glycerini TaxID=1763509 RepID=A0A255IKL3_9FIRM|nr:GntR family transcriptional regulator [Lachnotalea glycerini]PXV84907.1 DNA-binding GntR family transcriptional regulator [Lachnotalea glycerini]RDY29914.1 GntR family transcriptional regulator [Lachnotalea glycerini]
MNSTLNTNLKNQVYSIIKSKLINCEYPPGSILTEANLSKELNFSRTPIREAISILEVENLVKVLPKKGILVTDILLSDVFQIFQARMEIEPLTLRLASYNLPTEELIAWKKQFENQPVGSVTDHKMDTAMHLFIIENCGNFYIIDMMKKVFEKNTRIIVYSKQNSSHIHDARQEHIEILDSLIEQNYEQAASQMRSHIANCRKAAMDFFYKM